MQPCLITIKKKYDILTGAEKRIADFILKNYERIPSLAVSELAKESGTAGSAVIRFSKTLGYSGYSEMKMALAVETAKDSSFEYKPFLTADDTPTDIFRRIFADGIKTLSDTLENTDLSIFTKLTHALSKAERIYIYGIGYSAETAREFEYRLFELGYCSNAVCDPTTMMISTMSVKKGDFVIGISHSGRTRITVDTLKLAKEKGAQVACITSYPDSPITEVSDFPLVICSDEIEYPVESVSSKIAHLCMMNAITLALASENITKANANTKTTHKMINTLRY